MRARLFAFLSGRRGDVPGWLLILIAGAALAAAFYLRTRTVPGDVGSGLGRLFDWAAGYIGSPNP